MRRLHQVLLAFLGAALLALSAAAASLRSDVLFLLPKESGEVAFIDLQALRRSPHYEVIKRRMLPQRFAQFERFVRSTGVDVDKDLEWLAWVLVPPGPDNPEELFLGLAQGQFRPEAVEKFFLQQKLPLDAYRGQTLFPFGSGRGARDFFFTFLDSSTGAFGTRRSIELLLETRFGAHENLLYNETLFARLNEVNGRAPVWAVFDTYYTRLAVRQLVPEAAKFEQFSRLAERFRSSLLRLSLDREMTLSFQAWCAQPLDAQVLSLLLQTGLVAQSWVVQKSNPALSSVLSNAEVNSAGERLEVRVAIDEKDLRALLEQQSPLF
ncbi:MAG: hypothetical protein ACE5HL_00040 [Terriglobia bacterium]